MICIDDIKIDSPLYLAPMSGVTDAPFRRQASRFGASVVVTEMIAGSELAAGRKDVVWRIAKCDHKGPFVVQLAGRDPYWMEVAANIAAENGADIIDINMGCPSRLVTGGQSGSALMRDLNLARQLICATVRGSERPVTLKMRLGWDHDNLNAPELARIAEGEGVKLLTVHGRTRCQFYKGKADWNQISHVKQASSLPLIVNGDIIDADTARLALKQSGADGLMVGRAAIGRPWLLGEIKSAVFGLPFKAPSWSDKINSFCEQIDESLQLYGHVLGIRVVRKHLAAFISHSYEKSHSTQDVKRLRSEVCTFDDANELKSQLNRLTIPTENPIMEYA